MYTLCFLVASVKLKVYKKVIKFSFKQQKIIWVLVFSSIYLVLVDAKERSHKTNVIKKRVVNIGDSEFVNLVFR